MEPDRDHALPIDPDLAPSDPAEPGAEHVPAVSPTAAVRRRAAPAVLAAIALGGALGAPARYGMAQLVHVAPNSFPWATFWTNVSGSFALGLFLALLIQRFPPSRYLRPFVATGFLGAYTTYSTFAVEADLLVKDGHVPVAVGYVVASLVIGVTAAWAGVACARAMPRARAGVA